MTEVRQISCPSCSAPLDIKGLGRTSTLGCAYCGALINIDTEDLKIISEAKKLLSKPIIKIGSRGKFDGITFEIIGFIYRSDEAREYFWSEYLLFNPYRGFRWLSEYNNHWQFVTPLPYVPEIVSSGEYLGENYRRFSESSSVINEVIGELYWEARRWDKVKTYDFISPPKGLGLEESDDEVTASEFRYIKKEEIEKNFGIESKVFGLVGGLPSPVGVSLTEPNPHKKGLAREIIISVVLLAFLLAYQFKSVSFALNRTLLAETYSVVSIENPVAPDWTVNMSPDSLTHQGRLIVSAPFKIEDKVSNLQVSISSDLDNSWIYTDLTLASTDGQFVDEKSLEVSYYHGYDSDGSWSEGGTIGSVLFSSVPPGQYEIRVEPEVPARGMKDPKFLDSKNPEKFFLKAKQDVPYWYNFLVVLVGIIFFPIVKIIRFLSFEQRRWAESSLYGQSFDSDD